MASPRRAWIETAIVGLAFAALVVREHAQPGGIQSPILGLALLLVAPSLQRLVFRSTPTPWWALLLEGLALAAVAAAPLSGFVLPATEPHIASLGGLGSAALAILGATIPRGGEATPPTAVLRGWTTGAVLLVAAIVLGLRGPEVTASWGSLLLVLVAQHLGPGAPPSLLERRMIAGCLVAAGATVDGYDWWSVWPSAGAALFALSVMVVAWEWTTGLRRALDDAPPAPRHEGLLVALAVLAAASITLRLGRPGPILLAGVMVLEALLPAAPRSSDAIRWRLIACVTIAAGTWLAQLGDVRSPWPMVAASAAVAVVLRVVCFSPEVTRPRGERAAGLLACGAALSVGVAQGIDSATEAVFCAPFVLASAVGMAARALPRRTTAGLLGVLVVPLSLLALIEGAGQVYALRHPAYDVFAFDLDPVLGWKHGRNIHYPWAGSSWYAREFSLSIETNSYGFRDAEWAPVKPPGVVRVALLGDSMVEALQVPPAETAAGVLQRSLEAEAGDAVRFEVLNFGVSNYGLGQYLLVWEEYARRLGADYAFALVAGWHLKRTVEDVVVGVGGGRSVRPVFRLDGETLLRVPPSEVEAAQAAHAEALRARGGRVAVRPRSFFLGQVGDWLRFSVRGGYRSQRSNWQVSPEALAVNLAVLAELGEATRRDGARLVVVDASDAFDPDEQALPGVLKSFCDQHGLGYVSLRAPFDEARRRGIPMQWPWDRHMTEAGNATFAEAMRAWLVGERAARR